MVYSCPSLERETGLKEFRWTVLHSKYNMDPTWPSGLDHELGGLGKASSYEAVEVDVLKAILLVSCKPSHFLKAKNGLIIWVGN